MDVASDRADRGQTGARQTEQVMVHPLEMLADDVEVRAGHEMVDIGDTAGHGILDSNHRQPCAAFAHCRKGVIELRARQRRHVGKTRRQARSE